MSQTNEQRLTQRLMGYWKLIQKSLPMPLMEQFNSGAVDDLWPQCMMMSVDTRKGAIFKCEYMGDLLIKAYGRDMCGEVLEATNMAFPGISIYKALVQTVDSPAPREDAGFFLNKSGEMVKYRACFLPFGSESRGLTNIVVGLSFRAF